MRRAANIEIDILTITDDEKVYVSECKWTNHKINKKCPICFEKGNIVFLKCGKHSHYLCDVCVNKLHIQHGQVKCPMCIEFRDVISNNYPDKLKVPPIPYNASNSSNISDMDSPKSIQCLIPKPWTPPPIPVL